MKPLAIVERVNFHWGVTLRESNYSVCWDGDPELAQRKVDAIESAHRARVSEELEKYREKTIEIYEKGFEKNWVVQDVLDAIRSIDIDAFMDREVTREEKNG